MSENWKPVKDEAEFRDRFVGKQINGHDIQFVLEDDGSVTGYVNGHMFDAKWDWEGENFVRQALDGDPADRKVEDIAARGDQMRYREVGVDEDWTVVSVDDDGSLPKV